MHQEDMRPYVYKCVPGPKPVIVHQVIGEDETQKAIDICVRVPRKKPAIEQIVDVFVKKLKITSIEVITNKVIVRGCFEVKALYVACKPDQPVHAVEVQYVRFTAGVDIPDALCGMDADATVDVEFVDYSCDRRSRAYWHKKHNDCLDEYKKCKKPKRCTRKFNVSVVLRICAKVMSDREIIVYPAYPVYPGVPAKPKG